MWALAPVDGIGSRELDELWDQVLVLLEQTHQVERQRFFLFGWDLQTMKQFVERELLEVWKVGGAEGD